MKPITNLSWAQARAPLAPLPMFSGWSRRGWTHTGSGTIWRASQQFPPRSPARPATGGPAARSKLADCVRGLDTDPALWTWQHAAGTLRRFLPGAPGPAAAPQAAESEQAWTS